MSTQKATTQIAPMVVIDLGKKSRKKIKQLKRNEGQLVAEVSNATEMVRESLGPDVKGKTLVPVVFVYRRKRRRSKRGLFPFPFRF